MNYQAIGAIGIPGLPYARTFDSSSGGWGDGGGDTFDNWTGFKLTIGGVTSGLVTDAMMNDSSGAVTVQTITIGGQSVSVASMWHDRNHFCIQCRYSGSAVLSFGGGLGSDGRGALAKDGLLGSHGGTTDPRIWWRIIPLVPTDTVDFTCVGADPITVTCSAMTEGFALISRPGIRHNRVASFNLCSFGWPSCRGSYFRIPMRQVRRSTHEPDRITIQAHPSTPG